MWNLIHFLWHTEGYTLFSLSICIFCEKTFHHLFGLSFKKNNFLIQIDLHLNNLILIYKFLGSICYGTPLNINASKGQILMLAQCQTRYISLINPGRLSGTLASNCLDQNAVKWKTTLKAFLVSLMDGLLQSSNVSLCQRPVSHTQEKQTSWCI